MSANRTPRDGRGTKRVDRYKTLSQFTMVSCLKLPLKGNQPLCHAVCPLPHHRRALNPQQASEFGGQRGAPEFKLQKLLGKSSADLRNTEFD